MTSRTQQLYRYLTRGKKENETAARFWGLLSLLRPSWTQGHNSTFTYWAVEAQLVILRGREGLFSLELPRGSEFQAAVGPCPAASSVWRRPEGQTRLPVTLNYLPECDCACWEGRSRLCECVYVCAYEIYLCRVLLQAHLCFSRFNIHLLLVNTVAMFSWEADTSNLSMSL